MIKLLSPERFCSVFSARRVLRHIADGGVELPVRQAADLSDDGLGRFLKASLHPIEHDADESVLVKISDELLRLRRDIRS